MKNYKSTESLCFSFLFTQMIGLLFDMLTAVIFIVIFILIILFFCRICKYVQA